MKLTPRQYDLRKFLWHNRTRWVSSKEIDAAIPGFGGEKVAYKTINEDVKAINLSKIFDKMIITSRTKGYKLATKKEFWSWAKDQWAELRKKGDYITALVEEGHKNGQGVIPGLAGFQREFYDKFVEEEE